MYSKHLQFSRELKVIKTQLKNILFKMMVMQAAARGVCGWKEAEPKREGISFPNWTKPPSPGHAQEEFDTTRNSHLQAMPKKNVT